MELKDLVGEHLLSGCETGIHPAKETYDEDAGTVLFILDGITYKAIENPSDGYRSYLDEILITDEKISNTFDPQRVIGKMKDDKEDYHTQVNDTIQFFDAVTNKLVLEIGTDNADDYYPYCVMDWHPENLAININK